VDGTVQAVRDMVGEWNTHNNVDVTGVP
jgi:hypothetical protein